MTTLDELVQSIPDLPGKLATLRKYAEEGRLPLQGKNVVLSNRFSEVYMSSAEVLGNELIKYKKGFTIDGVGGRASAAYVVTANEIFLGLASSDFPTTINEEIVIEKSPPSTVPQVTKVISSTPAQHNPTVAIREVNVKPLTSTIATSPTTSPTVLTTPEIIPMLETITTGPETRRTIITETSSGEKISIIIEKEKTDLPEPPKLPGVELDLSTALVLTDPQNDFLSSDGAAWDVVGKSVTENNTVENLSRLINAAKSVGMPIFVSPHFYYPTDRKWEFGGALEHMMKDISMFEVKSPIDFSSFSGSGADFHPDLKEDLVDGETIIVSPHKVYGPSNNDLCLQLRKRGINKVILAGMSANLCLESHMRELIEQGFQVVMVKDATAAGKFQGDDLTLDGYQAALINFRFMANDVLDTNAAVMKIDSMAGFKQPR